MGRIAARRRIMRVVGDTGPRKRTVLVGLAGGDAGVVKGLVGDGSLVRIGKAKGALYGTPEQRRGARG